MDEGRSLYGGGSRIMPSPSWVAGILHSTHTCLQQVRNSLLDPPKQADSVGHLLGVQPKDLFPEEVRKQEEAPRSPEQVLPPLNPLGLQSQQSSRPLQEEACLCFPQRPLAVRPM